LTGEGASLSETLHQLGEQHVATFLLQLLLLLGLARGLGYVFQRIGQPALVGEILVGLLLGPTLLGRLAPGLHARLFPSDAVQFAMLDTVSWIGLLLLLLSAGLEVDVSVAWRQRGDALKIALSDIILPLMIGFVPALLLPERYMARPDQRILFALFVATALMISALPMTVRALHDLDLLKSDLGLLILSALIINDIIGWAIFTLILGFATQARLDLAHIASVVGGTVVFAALCMTAGRWLVGGVIARIQKRSASDTGMMLTFVCCVGMLTGLITQRMGIHALFGLFLAGVMAGGTPALSERTRHVINQMVYAVFVPVFFASIGLKVDFLANFDAPLALLFTIVGIGGKYVGARVGARMTSLSRWDREFVAVTHTPGGSMEMIVALVALQQGLITVPVFVAIVFAALVSSIVLGPWLAWLMRRRPAINVLDIFLRRATRLGLRGETRWDAIQELCEAAAEQESLPAADALHAAVRAREETAGTALGEGIAVPHARLPGLRKPAVVLGRSIAGIDWDTPDGLPAHLIFLILTPEEDNGLQVQILGALAHGLQDEELRHRLIAARDEQEAWSVLRQALGQQNLLRARV
jgi:Kef-type K+ transport system membrane component KefB/mannitol/fructose-specific phosphotransferase system IIA component (Ntr-type)